MVWYNETYRFNYILNEIWSRCYAPRHNLNIKNIALGCYAYKGFMSEEVENEINCMLHDSLFSIALSNLNIVNIEDLLERLLDIKNIDSFFIVINNQSEANTSRKQSDASDLSKSRENTPKFIYEHSEVINSPPITHCLSPPSPMSLDNTKIFKKRSLIL